MFANIFVSARNQHTLLSCVSISFFSVPFRKIIQVPNSDEIWLENQKKVYTARFCDDGIRIIALAACYLARAHTILRIYAVEEVATAADVVVVVVAAPHLARHSR